MREKIEREFEDKMRNLAIANDVNYNLTFATKCNYFSRVYSPVFLCKYYLFCHTLVFKVLTKYGDIFNVREEA